MLPSGRYPQATVRQWEGAEILCTSLPAPRAHLHPQGLTGGLVPRVKAPGPARGHPDREPGAGPGGALQITTCALPPVATSQEPSCKLPHCPGTQACKPGCLSKQSRSDPWTAAAKTQSQMPIKVPLGEFQPPEVVGREPRQWPPYP